MPVQSNNEYIKQNTSNINGSIKSSSVFGGVQHSSFPNSSASCPSLEPNIVETFLGTCKEVFKRTQEDLDNVSKIGDGFVSMDNVMANTAKTLNMEVKSTSSPIGEVALTDSRDSEIPSNAQVRQEIQDILDEKGADFKLPERKSEEETNTRTYNPGGYNPTSGGSTPSVGSQPQTTERPTEVTTQTGTTHRTEPRTSAPERRTIPPTEARPERTTQSKIDEVIIPRTEPRPQTTQTTQTQSSQPKVEKIVSQNNNYNSGVERFINNEIKPTEEPIVQDLSVEDPVIEDPIIENYDESFLEEQLNAPIVEIKEEPVQPKAKTSGVGTAAAVIAAGAAIGGAAYGASKYLKDKELDEDSEYGWEA